MNASGHIDTFARDNLPPQEQWPQFVFDRPELLYPDRLNCAAAFLDRWVEAGQGERICLVTPDEILSYGELQQRVNRICNVLVRQCGLVPGGRVLLRSTNSAMMAACCLAAVKAGGVIVPTMPLLRSAEIAYPLAKAKVSIALCDRRLADEMESARRLSPDLKTLLYWGDGSPGSLEALMAAESSDFAACDTAADDVCMIAFTSGTTGAPKGTLHFHRDMLAICDSYARNILCANADDRFLGSAPFAFTFGLGGALLFPMRIGASSVLIDKAGPDQLLAAIARHRATICFTAPTAYRAMLPNLAEYDVSSLRKCVSAGEPLPKATFEAWRTATGITLMDGIGATEMLHIFIAAREDAARPGATGKPVPGYEAKVVDDEGRALPAGSVGRLAVRGPTGCRYLADPRQLDYVRDGWNFTSDAYLVDEDGYFWHQARSDDMIVSSGYNIAGPEVEAAILAHPAVAECGVVGSPDPDRGRIVKAYVVLRPDWTAGPELARALQDHVKQAIAPFKYPRAVEFVAELPKTASGKLQRFRLRKMAEAQAAAAEGQRA